MKYAHLQGRRYVSLVRCSTDEQADTSPADQAAVLRAFGDEHGMVHAGDDVVLEGVSGSMPGNRDDIARIVARKQARDDFDVLLVQDTSRLTRGGAQVSEMHCNFLINRGGASAADIEGLGEEVRRRVRETSGVELRWEIKRIGVETKAVSR